MANGRQGAGTWWRWTGCAAAAILLAAATGCCQRPKPASADAAASVSLAAEDSRTLHTVLWYIPNRLLDLADVVSVGVSVPYPPYWFPGGWAHGNVHATRAAQVGAGGTHGVFFGNGYGRRLMWGLDYDELSLGPYTVATIENFQPSHDFMDLARVDRSGMLYPSDPPFEKGHMDYWSVGGQASLILVAALADVHPIEVVDFVLGIFLIDIQRDDH